MIAIRPTPRPVFVPVAILNLVRDRVEIRVVGPRLDEQNRMVRILRQPRRKNGPGRARADDDCVVCVGDFGRTLGGVTCTDYTPNSDTVARSTTDVSEIEPLVKTDAET